MKRIYLTLTLLVLAMTGMAYLYFSRLNRENTYNEISLYAATANSGLVFSIQNDKSIFQILKGQDLFEKILGEDKFNQLSLLKETVFNTPAIQTMLADRDVFISFSAGKSKTIDYLISTQLNDEKDKPLLSSTVLKKGKLIKDTAGLFKLILNDTATFYLGMEKNLLLVSNQPEQVISALKTQPSTANEDFINYIKSNHKLRKNSIGSVFIDFNKVPAIIKSIIPGSLNGNLALFNQQNSYAALNYNFSSERLFFSGNTLPRDAGNYLNLFASTAPQKISIDNLLPESTANFRLYAIPAYTSWRKSLVNWFETHKEGAKIKAGITNINKEYHLDVEEIFPQYFKDQIISFQLRSAESLGAINLSNGDKVRQLLIDLSESYDQDIKQFKVHGLLYFYFGEPFRKFDKPYYTIIDNYLIFANHPRTLQTFLQSYSTGKLLVNNSDYINLYTQLSNTSTVNFYVNQKNSADLVRNNAYLPYYRHFLSKNALGKFSSMLYQLNGDRGTFQTNLLINTLQEQTDIIPTDSLVVIR